MEAERQNGRNRKLQITRYTRDQQGQVTETIDALGRAEKVQYPDGREVSYTYGKAGERRSITYPDGTTVFYGYDEQFRLSELQEGGRIITYGYDTVGRLCEKQFPNGTKTTYRYDRKDQLTELLHQDQEGILDCYTYLYDLLGNKTGITKERRGLEHESGQYRYGYDALGRLSEIQKDGEIQTRYGYDAFGNRTWKEERGEETSYQYNVLNQMVSERQGDIRKEYSYDKRGNLTRILENGTWKKQYVYGAMNRLEEAVDAAGKQARYQYNGLGHRVGKQEGVFPKEKLEKLDPQRRVGMEIGNSRQITYTLDLTRQYHNLLERTEESRSQRYFWDGNVAAYEENGERNYYLQDELGSPLRIEDSAGTIKESYGYGAFGEDLYQNQGERQPFGYTGYQRDEIAGTYYAQAREYLEENGRFAGQDLIAGFLDMPFSMNRYSYCFNAPMILVDLDGAWPSWSDIGKGIKKGIKDVGNALNKGIKKVGNIVDKGVEKFKEIDWEKVGRIGLNVLETIAAVGVGTIAVATVGSIVGVGAAVVAGVGITINAVYTGYLNHKSGKNFFDGLFIGSVNTSVSVFLSTVFGAPKSLLPQNYIGKIPNILLNTVFNTGTGMFSSILLDLANGDNMDLEKATKNGLLQGIVSGALSGILSVYIKDQIISAAAGFIQQFITSEDCENMFQKMSYSF